ncbi:adenylate/guanylate cyclase domain-containing protein [Corynebacterium yudongzhengii]|uniref:HAMP domain-containing protein n=1 Tax=Corynebacterium yudongzhengii TaxID=2080740 RepID=A0A2U1T5D7_9CORY|nr:adenylate/guanylate cyclase domain-containing protein [Corynebacterium yudongzhengii]AWB81105.1 adenylate/guanylate cyclase domain-containing protein [Corynebacterium yudongzhengii]PWC01203.1 HAMP domain-containing protein [Corynebacterium yudongzhengii]
MDRILRALKWLWGTSWPLYAALVLSSNLIGAVGIMLFIRYLLPLPELQELELGWLTLTTLGVLYVGFAIIVAVGATLLLFRPVLDWQRDPDRHDPNMVRYLVMRIPIYQAIVCAVVWGIGIAIAVGVIAATSGQTALVVGIALILAAAVIVLLTYLQAERMVRPVAAAALAQRFEDATLEPPITHRLRITWIMTTAAPVVGILLLIAGQRAGFFTDRAADLDWAVFALSITALITGYIGTSLSTASVTDPIHELQDAVTRVRRGDHDVRVDIYDGSEIGVLQAGFNEMMRGLKERQRVRDIFGQYVGSEVAERALEERPQLGGEDRKVAVLFIDVIGSTGFAVNHSPEEVVTELNKFFDVVVDVVHRNKGVINKFQGDAALAVFGAPLNVNDATSWALTAAREMRSELRELRLQAGIGVAAGHVVAGNIGGHDRFEYTVIGDAVNLAARLTEMAKDTPGRVLTNAATLRSANEAEQRRWTTLKSVELRGRNKMTQLARPVRSTMADRA